MIEFKLAKDGSRIFTWQGRHICSGHRPIEEARAWAERQMTKIGSEKSLIILGLANGYHAAELAKLNPGKEIYVVNDNQEFVSPACNVLELNSSLFEILTAKTLDDLKRQAKFQKVFKNSFVLLDFAPATQLKKDFYRQVRDQLLGRTQESLKFYLECRSDAWAGVDCSGLSEKSTYQGLQLISFKDLKNIYPNRFLRSRAHNIIGVLEELIK